MRIALALRPATQESFAPFGRLITPQAPSYRSPGFDWHENLAQSPMGVVELGVVTPKYTGDFHQAVLERHVNSEEIIAPLKEDVLLVLGKAETFEGAPRPDHFAALYLRAGEIAVLGKGVWHEAPKCFAKEAPCLVLYAADTGKDDKELLSMKEMDLELVVTDL